MPSAHDPVASHLPLKPTALHILLSLAGEERHGYAIIKEISERTRGEVELHPGILYRFLKRLLDGGLIRELEHRPVPAAEDDERRRYYAVTEAGRAVARAELERMGTMIEWGREVHLVPPQGRAGGA
ncbi:MAG TPA: PadR family transcriptional regulator [Longimicrobiales bacterium]|nr:PadR family transcriptional regulator [Longimicrobiales bacterium]